MKAGELCTRDAHTAYADESVVDVARRMAEYQVGALIVIEDGPTGPRPIGIVTDRDLVTRRPAIIVGIAIMIVSAHSGYLPRLCKLGFTGPIHATPGTRDLLGILLPDAGHLQEEEARHANQRTSRSAPASPRSRRCRRTPITPS